MPFLLLLILLPFVSAIIVLCLVKVPASLIKAVAFVLSLLPLSWLLYTNVGWIGTHIAYRWFPALSIRFELAVDSLSLLFLFLTALIIPISIGANRQVSLPQLFYSLILFLEGLLFIFFTARDLAIFTLFWEAMLIPLYLIIMLWGGSERGTASLKFLIYMIAGSALMVAAVLTLYFQAQTFDIKILSDLAHSLPSAPWILAIFLLAFAVKTPLFPLHGWLPDAYYFAPTSGTILLSALLSKAGIYGIIRIGLGFFPMHMKWISPWLLGLAITGVFYAAFAAWSQRDYKRLIAYSSLSHINFVLAGFFIWAPPAQTGAVLQALNHGITIAALFLVAGWLEERLGNTLIGPVSGLCKFLPRLCWWTLFFVLAAIALPGTNNFVGELLILLGLFAVTPWTAAFLALSVILSALYMLRWMQKVYFESPTFFQQRWTDMRLKEVALATPLMLLILWIGIYPAPLLDLIHTIPLKEIANQTVGGRS